MIRIPKSYSIFLYLFLFLFSWNSLVKASSLPDLVEKLTSWIGYGLVFIGLLLLVNVALIMYLVIKK